MAGKSDGVVGAVSLIVVAALAAVVGAIILRGWVLTYLWKWFVVPVFFVPALSIPAAIGISAMVSMVAKDATTGGDIDRDDNPINQVLVVLGRLLLAPLVVLGLGWVVAQWM